ncbi:hypothetical protein ACS0TY_014045 [Phlomoides rotata]
MANDHLLICYGAPSCWVHSLQSGQTSRGWVQLIMCNRKLIDKIAVMCKSQVTRRTTRLWITFGLRGKFDLQISILHVVFCSVILLAATVILLAA